MPRKASLARAVLASSTIGDRIRTNTNIVITTLHDAEIVGSTLYARVGAMSELEHSLRVPLSISAHLGVAREAHTSRLERCFDGDGAAPLANVGGCGFLDHLEVAGDLVEGDFFDEVAVVVDVELEGVLGSAGLEVGECCVCWCCCCCQS